MAISANSVFEIRTTATAGNVNGGFFVTGASGTDYSQQDAAQYNLTGCTSSGAGNTVLTASAADDMVGNGAYVVSGTNFTSTVAAAANRFEVVSVVAGVSITFSTNAAGASICTGVGSNGVINIGGALSLGSSDDAVFEAAVAGVKYWIKNGTYTISGNIGMSAGGTMTKPIVVEGYNSTRGDKPTGSTRPTLAFGANAVNFGIYTDVYNLIMTGTATGVALISTGGKMFDCKVVNSSTTAARVALTAGANCAVYRCELISYRGIAVQSARCLIYGCYIHSSNIGVQNNTAETMTLINCIIESCVQYAVNVSSVYRQAIVNCTMYGAENKLGVGLNVVTGNNNISAINNIFYGFVTGIAVADVQTNTFDTNNCFYNNTTNATNWTISSTSVTTAPSFTSVSQVTGTTATTSGVVLTDTGKNFTTAGVVAGRDYVYIVSGTGVTVGVYGIAAVGTTTIDLDIAPGTNATADKVYQITIGHDYRVGTNMKAGGEPVAYPGGYTTSYVDIGGVQRVEPSSGGGTVGFSSGS